MKTIKEINNQLTAEMQSIIKAHNKDAVITISRLRDIPELMFPNKLPEKIENLLTVDEWSDLNKLDVKVTCINPENANLVSILTILPIVRNIILVKDNTIGQISYYNLNKLETVLKLL